MDNNLRLEMESLVTTENVSLYFFFAPRSLMVHSQIFHRLKVICAKLWDSVISVMKLHVWERAPFLMVHVQISLKVWMGLSSPGQRWISRQGERET